MRSGNRVKSCTHIYHRSFMMVLYANATQNIHTQYFHFVAFIFGECLLPPWELIHIQNYTHVVIYCHRLHCRRHRLHCHRHRRCRRRHRRRHRRRRQSFTFMIGLSVDRRSFASLSYYDRMCVSVETLKVISRIYNFICLFFFLIFRLYSRGL